MAEFLAGLLAGQLLAPFGEGEGRQPDGLYVIRMLTSRTIGPLPISLVSSAGEEAPQGICTYNKYLVAAFAGRPVINEAASGGR